MSKKRPQFIFDPLSRRKQQPPYIVCYFLENGKLLFVYSLRQTKEEQVKVSVLPVSFHSNEISWTIKFRRAKHTKHYICSDWKLTNFLKLSWVFKYKVLFCFTRQSEIEWDKLLRLDAYRRVR